MVDMDLQDLSIPKFYAGRHIFITGGSGFIGKVLVEKIIRSCPDVAGLHLLLREKKGVAPADRIKDITQIKLFNVLRKENPNFEEKLHVVSGDISLPGLGLSPEIREYLIKNISIIFHAAATVRFDDPLTNAIFLNVRGTRDLALMAREMPDLAVFVHISTTYCNTDRKIIDEKLYPPHGNWRTLLAAAEKLDPTTMEIVTSKLMNNLPNTYTFTKSLAEHCLHEILEGKCLVIVRPSIVISALSEPLKGWVDNFHGPVGLMVACGKGLVHISLARSGNIADYMPVDICVKVLLVAAFKHGSKKTVEKSPPVYNCSSAAVKPVTTAEVRQMARKAAAAFPLNDVLWIPCGFMTTSRTVLLLGTLVLHMIPAIFLDTVLRFKGQKPRLVKLQRRIYAAQLALAPFLLNSWIFKNSKALLLDKDVPVEDSKAFSFDFLDEDKNEYFQGVAIGGRRYLLNEDDDTLPAARAHYQRMTLINKLVKFIGIIFLVWLFLSISLSRLATMTPIQTAITPL